MDVVTLGTGSPIPDPHRAGPATLVRAGDANLLFDCGRGVLMRLAAAGLPFPAQLTAVFLTHLHSDHITDLNDLITTHWVTSPAEAGLTLIGPPGTQQLVDATLAMLTPDIGYRTAHHEDLTGTPRVHVTEVADGLAFATSSLAVTAAPTDHRPVSPTIGFRIESEGAVVAIAGDTIPCDGLDRLCEQADIYVQTVIHADLIRTIPSARLQDILDYHSSVQQAAQTAARQQVKHLVMTHPVPAPPPGNEAAWVELAAEYFDGQISMAVDMFSAQTA